MKKYFSIMVVPHDNTNMRNYRLSYTLVYAFIALVLFAVITGVVFVVTYGKVLRTAYQATILANENAELRARNAQIDSLRTELVQLQTMSIQIKNMLGVNLSFEDSVLVANLSPAVTSRVASEGEMVAEETRAEQQRLLKAIPSFWPVKGYVTREFFTTGGQKSEHYHPGMDIAVKSNTPVKSAAESVVVESGWDDTYGYRLLIDHGFGITTLYGHNSRILVHVGDRVTRGQTIAFAGSTGKSTAPHLHFEVRKNGVPVDPRNYLLN